MQVSAPWVLLCKVSDQHTMHVLFNCIATRSYGAAIKQSAQSFSALNAQKILQTQCAAFAQVKPMSLPGCRLECRVEAGFSFLTSKELLVKQSARLQMATTASLGVSGRQAWGEEGIDGILSRYRSIAPR